MPQATPPPQPPPSGPPQDAPCAPPGAGGPAAPLPWLVLTSVATPEQAQQLARSAVAQRLAACAQIEAIASVYRWQGAVQEEAEWRILFKTAPARVDALLAALRAIHPYTLPALHAWPAHRADPAYAQWVQHSTDATTP